MKREENRRSDNVLVQRIETDPDYGALEKLVNHAGKAERVFPKDLNNQCPGQLFEEFNRRGLGLPSISTIEALKLDPCAGRVSDFFNHYSDAGYEAKQVQGMIWVEKSEPPEIQALHGGLQAKLPGPGSR